MSISSAYAAGLTRAQTQGREVARTFYPMDGTGRAIRRDMDTGRYRLRIPAPTRPHHRADLCGPFGRTMP